MVEALGPDDKELCWSGRFQSPNAGPRARHLDYLRRQGAAQTLSWDQFSYTVVIRAFEADYERAYQIPYRIACLVVADNTQPIAASPSAPVNELVSADAAALSSLASASGNAAIASGVGEPAVAPRFGGSARSGGRRLARADPEPAREPRRADRGRHRGSGKRLRRRPRGFWRHGGRRGGGGSTSLRRAQFDVLAILVEMQALGRRIAFNVGQASPAASARTITVAGGNLFRIAAAELGDATQWNRIAALNGLADPVLSGVMQLRLPPLDPGAGGGLSG